MIVASDMMNMMPMMTMLTMMDGCCIRQWQAWYLLPAALAALVQNIIDPGKIVEDRFF